MDVIHQIIQVILHPDVQLNLFAQQYGPWVYLLMFAIIFCETGLVVTPFLPGDSLLFLVGAMAAKSDAALSVSVAFFVLAAAAVIGDSVNYQIGHYLGPKVLIRPHGRILKKEYLDRTHRYFEKYGPSTIILARFVPIVRTFAPFVAGVGAMTYGRFLTYNVLGAALWVMLVLALGFWIGRITWVSDHFFVVEIIIIAISLVPMAVEYWRFRHQRGEQS